MFAKLIGILLISKAAEKRILNEVVQEVINEEDKYPPDADIRPILYRKLRDRGIGDKQAIEILGLK